MRIRLLGPIEVVTPQGSVALGGPKQRAVLAALALVAGRTVTVESLIDAVWGEDAHDRANGVPPRVLVRCSGVFALDVDPADVDALRGHAW